METKMAGGRESAQRDSGTILQAFDSSTGHFRPTPLGQDCPGPVAHRNPRTGNLARSSRFSSHRIPDHPVSILVIYGSAP